VQEAFKQRANDAEFLPEKFKKGFVFDKSELQNLKEYTEAT
jgi:hypothetical protein